MTREGGLWLYLAHYSFCRIRGSLRVTPAMAAGITSIAWTTEELLNEGMLLQGNNNGNERNSDSND